MAKSFKDRIQQTAINPTLQFVAQPEPEEIPTAQAERRPAKKSTVSATERKAPPARRAIPEYEETKSRRLQLLLTPSLYEAIKDKAAKERLSVNEYINSELKKATER